MKTPLALTKTRIIFVILFQLAALLCAGYGRAALFPQFVTIDFNKAQERDYGIYTEDGFSLTANTGAVRINSAFPPGSPAASPSAGFGQDEDSSLIFKNQQHRAFSAVSIDLLEATGFPDTFGITMIGTKADYTVVTQTFILDGIAGAQTFTFSSDFTDLVSLKIAKNFSDSFETEDVQIDNLRLFQPGDTIERKVKTEIFGQVFGGSRSNAPPIPVATIFPLTTHIAIYDTNSRLVEWCTSDRRGNFHALLFPGDYTLVGMPIRQRREQFVSHPVDIVVPQSGLSDVELDYGLADQ